MFAAHEENNRRSLFWFQRDAPNLTLFFKLSFFVEDERILKNGLQILDQRPRISIMASKKF